MVESNAFGDARVVKDGVGGMGERAAWNAVGSRGKIEIPKAGVGGTLAGEHGSAVVFDGNGSGREVGYAAMIAELADRDEGAGGEVGEDVGLARSWG